MSTLGERIRMIRNAVPRQAFADKYGIHRNTLERWEKDKRQPDESFLAALIAGENITQKWLLLGEGPLHPESPSEPSDSKNVRCRTNKTQQYTEIVDAQRNTVQNVGHFETQHELNSLNKELRETMRQNGDLLRQNGDLRVEVEQLRARVRDLERELREALKPEEGQAPMASAG